ncbi:hypothetical protein ACFQE1_06675 [Halobium palmae]|uniref:Uncharacterized protein n=1 Tax=Halobium palmae TaxID=1776492 RepID=A0ABD5RYH4_9EURY
MRNSVWIRLHGRDREPGTDYRTLSWSFDSGPERVVDGAASEGRRTGRRVGPRRSADHSAQ